MNRPANVEPPRFGTKNWNGDTHWSDPPRAAAPVRRQFIFAQADGPRVDAHTAELRERIAAASRVTIMGVLLPRR